MPNTAVFRVTLLFTLVVAVLPAAHAQAVMPPLVQSETATPPSLRAALARAAVANPMRAPLSAAAAQAPTNTTRTCRRSRRAWIGALIGAGASVPLAMLAHSRFENENANGAGAAVTMIALGAGGGALVGVGTCR